jgi:hypothetical protein
MKFGWRKRTANWNWTLSWTSCERPFWSWDPKRLQNNLIASFRSSTFRIMIMLIALKSLKKTKRQTNLTSLFWWRGRKKKSNPSRTKLSSPKTRSISSKISSNWRLNPNSLWKTLTKHSHKISINFAPAQKLSIQSPRNSTKKLSNFKSKTKSSKTNSSKNKNIFFSSMKTSTTFASKLIITNHKKNNSLTSMKTPFPSLGNLKEPKILKFKNFNRKKTSGKNSVNSGEMSLRKSLLLNNKKSPSWKNSLKWDTLPTSKIQNFKKRKPSNMKTKKESSKCSPKCTNFVLKCRHSETKRNSQSLKTKKSIKNFKT